MLEGFERDCRNLTMPAPDVILGFSSGRGCGRWFSTREFNELAFRKNLARRSYKRLSSNNENCALVSQAKQENVDFRRRNPSNTEQGSSRRSTSGLKGDR
jgi:hypothetical protein